MATRADPTGRFSSKVDNYLKYRPHYPKAVLDLLQRECGLAREWIIADIGSGTGFSAELFLAHGNHVYGVEPNEEMRSAGEAYLVTYPNFTSVVGTAEDTTLPDASVDLVLAGQAFHWFDRERARAEFLRISRGKRWLALMWNSRDEDSPFQQDYEQMLLAFGTDYVEIRHTNLEDADIGAFFVAAGCDKARFHNNQVVDLQGLTGRVLSSSYVPVPGDPRYEPMLAELARLFQVHQVDGFLSFEYHTDVYYGRLA